MIIFLFLMGICLIVYLFSKEKKEYATASKPDKKSFWSGFLKFFSSPWKLFWKLVSLAALAGVCYGIYLFVSYSWPTEERLAFRELTKNLAEKEIRPDIERLKSLADKAKEKGLTMAEKKEAEGLAQKTKNIRKDYSQGKLTAPPPKSAPAKSKEEVWIFGWMATDELMKENNKQKPFSEYIANDVKCSDKELSFVCYKGKKQEDKDKIVLKRDNKEQAYVGYLFNKIKKEYTPIWLIPENGMFKGYIFANNGPKIIATLKKQKRQNQ